MPCARFDVLPRVDRTSRGCWVALGALLSACDPVVATVGIMRSSDGGLTAIGPDGADGSPRDAGSSTGRDGESPAAGDAAAPRDCVELIDLSLFVSDAGISGPIGGHTLKEVGCSQLDGGMWLEPTNSSVWQRKDGEPLLEANQPYSFFFTEAINLNRLRLTGGREPCDTRKIYEEVPFLPHLPAPTCRTLHVGFAVYFLRHSGGQALFLPNPANSASYQLCKGGCE